MYLNIIGQQIEIFILKSCWFNNFKFHIVFKTCYTQHTQIKEQTNKFIENTYITMHWRKCAVKNNIKFHIEIEHILAYSTKNAQIILMTKLINNSVLSKITITLITF